MRDNSYAKLFRFVVRHEAAEQLREELCKRENVGKVIGMFQPPHMPPSSAPAPPLLPLAPGAPIGADQEYQAVAVVRTLVKVKLNAT